MEYHKSKRLWGCDTDDGWKVLIENGTISTQVDLPLSKKKTKTINDEKYILIQFF